MNKYNSSYAIVQCTKMNNITHEIIERNISYRWISFLQNKRIRLDEYIKCQTLNQYLYQQLFLLYICIDPTFYIVLNRPSLLFHVSYCKKGCVVSIYNSKAAS